MAGTLQTLNFIRASPRSPWKPNLPPNRPQLTPHSFLSNPNSSLHQRLRTVSHTIRASQGFNQVNGDENQPDKTAESSKELYWVQPLLSFFSTNFLPLALVTGVVLGLANPSLGCLAHKYSLSKFSTFGIFVISGLTLRSKEIGKAAEAWPTGLFGLVSILLLSPYFSKLILQIRMVPQEFVTGLAIFSCMPTTLSSGVALTQLVGGNTALALAMTVISNLLGILIVPFSISKFIADGVGVSVPTGELFRSLVITLLVPLVLGKVLRDYFNGVSDYVDQNRKLLSMISAILLSLVPWIQVSRSRSLLLMVKPAVFLVAIAMGTILHFILLALNTVAAQSFSVAFGGEKSVISKKENLRALILVSSQVLGSWNWGVGLIGLTFHVVGLHTTLFDYILNKTLPVMVAVVDQLRGSLGESGLLVLPCVAAHINQIVIDSVLVNLWLRKDQQVQSMQSAKACET